MAYYRRTGFRTRGRGLTINRWLLAIAVLAILIVVTRVLADRPQATANTNAVTSNADLSLLNLSENANVGESANRNVNASPTVASGGAGEFPQGFLTDYCPRAVSVFGSKKLVALTFNAVSDTAGFGDILRTLTEKQTPAAVFMAGSWAAENVDVAHAFADAGLGVYSYGYDHTSFPDLSAAKQRDQLTRAETAITEATGVTTSKPAFRPPFGDLDDETAATVRAAGYCPILWTIDARDWQDGQTADQSKQRVLDGLRSGAIVMMQVGTATVPEFLGALIDGIRAAGYTLVGLPQLFSDNPVATTPTNANVGAGANTNAPANANGG